ncbi:hypothetical protein DERF_002616 [Dermatophagoides farinae]|uniref:Uncharacterized protein n=1 Tax=Dermatophagoides farinae TaxID=6954 RepID=A0A922IE35_DERFA|nr:hypothetical protein DERF_002616 [Dermatophagoides farinae]
MAYILPVCFVCLLIEIKSIILRDDNDYHHVCKIAIEEKFFKNPEVHVGILIKKTLNGEKIDEMMKIRKIRR